MFSRSALSTSLLPCPQGYFNCTVPLSLFGNSANDTAIEGLISDAWYAAFSTPNATGSSTIQGYNLTSPYPGSKSDDWTYTIKVRDDIPLQDGNVATGTWIELEAPKSLLVDIGNGSIVPQDPSWHVCRTVFTAPNLTSDAGIPGPGCEGFLPSDCLSDLTTDLSTSFHDPNRTSFDNPCPLPKPKDLPQSCKDTFGTGLLGILEGECAASINIPAMLVN